MVLLLYGSTEVQKPVNFILVQDLIVVIVLEIVPGLSEPVLLVNPGAVASDMSTLNFPNDASGRIDIGYGPYSEKQTRIYSA